ncbi:MAG: two-component sensor histidine kinase [Deltaproteobacteria bacterium]|nr:MAG: two-component sensor histidine kinase [Deltaproteobacteria bacterium]
MNKIPECITRFLPPFWRETATGRDPQSLFSYRRVWWWVIISMTTVSILPLLLLTVMNLNQYQRSVYSEMVYPASRLVSNVKRSVSFFLEERRSALTFLVEDNSFEQLTDKRHLGKLFVHLKKSFGGFIDLGVIDVQGRQRAYVGPYPLQDKNYKEQTWFGEVVMRGIYISDVFRGFRDVPHFIIAVKHEQEDGSFFILRATIDTSELYDLVEHLDIRPGWDAFIVNKEGLLQTPSRSHGKVLEASGVQVPPYSTSTKILQTPDWITGYAYIPKSPFIFMLLREQGGSADGWDKLRNEVLIFLGVSVVVILFVILGVVTFLVNRIYMADKTRSAAMRRIEHTGKMASIGRLAAGVAHEINNPLAIINEKSGLIKDLLTYSKDYKEDPRLLDLIEAVLRSVERCSTITHRLLGFARHIDVRVESLDMANLLEEVLGFLKKEAEYRDIHIGLHADEDLPEIQSDRGQLQQVFLNIVNNAFAAVDNGGEINIGLHKIGTNRVAVMIADNGKGISPENLKRIFDPFFSTKTKQGGTGLGLSITYGLVEKLGGSIRVQSQLGEGTTFTIELPVKR